VPLVGSNVQGIRDYVVDGETGFLCDAQDHMAFAAAISKLTKATDTKKLQMSDACREMAKNFDKSVSIQQMRKIYVGILLNP
jgi:glycosyltransferase involved in cell wall biosynthesis